MSKQPGKRRNEKKVVEEKPLVPQKFETPILIVLILISLVVFLHEAIFQNKIFNSGDIEASISLQPFLDQASRQNVFPLWVPYVFSGMPCFASLLVGADRWYDISVYIWETIDHVGSVFLVNKDVGWVMIYYFLFGIGIFTLLRTSDSHKVCELLRFGGYNILHIRYPVDNVWPQHEDRHDSFLPVYIPSRD